MGKIKGPAHELLRYTTYGITAVLTVVVPWFDAGTVEVEVARVAAAVGHRRPEVAVRAYAVHAAAAVAASAYKRDRRLKDAR